MEGKRGSLTSVQADELLTLLQSRFTDHAQRHPGMAWRDVRARLLAAPDRLWSLSEMERTGGEPDVVCYDKAAGEFVFIDCAAESPVGRHSVCYDDEALKARKINAPLASACGMAAEMGIEVLTEEQYRELQTSGSFDLRSSSWVKTPDSVRKLGGALFCDRRYDRVFIYHNSAESYYAARGFRGILRV